MMPICFPSPIIFAVSAAPAVLLETALGILTTLGLVGRRRERFGTEALALSDPWYGSDLSDWNKTELGLIKTLDLEM
ncbi:hypothetical protein DL95DRAFT_390198, partial [Leptodontidium sp. 2 PMI_412]